VKNLSIATADNGAVDEEAETCTDDCNVVSAGLAGDAMPTPVGRIMDEPGNQLLMES
jgi:hypothetical protein